MSNDPSFSGEERRQTNRIRGILVGFRQLGSQDEFQGVFLRDMSLKGVSFTTKENLAVDDLVEMNIYLTDAKNPVLVTGKVRWIEKSQYFTAGANVHYDAGVEITEINDDNLKALEKYMRVHEGLTIFVKSTLERMAC